MIYQNNLIHINFKNSTLQCMYCDMIVHGCLKDTVIELLLFFVRILLFLPH